MLKNKLIIMIRVFLVAGILLFAGTLNAQNLYSISVYSIEGVKKPLTICQGKKILVVTLPVQQTTAADTLLQGLAALHATYGDSLIIIATPSYEDGYTPQIKSSLQQWYRTILPASIIVTEGLFTRKTSSTQQHPLFKFLTSKERNLRFDQDVTGPNSKFVIWKNGEMIGVLDAQTAIAGSVIHGLLDQ